MSKPNTLEAWYMDAIRFLYSRYRWEPDTVLDEVASRFALRMSHRWKKFDPAKASAFTYLCWCVRAAYFDTKRRQRESKDMMECGLMTRYQDQPNGPSALDQAALQCFTRDKVG